jgi:hypothetical protein
MAYRQFVGNGNFRYCAVKLPLDQVRSCPAGDRKVASSSPVAPIHHNIKFRPSKAMADHVPVDHVRDKEDQAKDIK